MIRSTRQNRALALVQSRQWWRTAAEHVDFLAAWLRRPRQTASVVPSSRYLARLMARGIDPNGGRVLELGGGTGAFTREILHTGLAPERLEVVEINPDLARSLRRHFPAVDILECPAQSVSACAKGGAGEYQSVVSGLPLLAMDKASHAAILREAFALLGPDGEFLQFTYAPRSPVSRDVLDALGLQASKVGQVVRNFPPATVFRYTRKG